MMAHMYEEQVAVYGRIDLANKAMKKYRQAIEADRPRSILTSGFGRTFISDRPHPDAVWKRRMC